MQSQKFMWVGRDFFGIAEFGIVNNNGAAVTSQALGLDD